MTDLELKKKLKSVCLDFMMSKLTTIEDTIKSLKEALYTESKSSVGDKHETGRAMLQLEMEKAGQQLKFVSKMKLIVEKMNVSSLTEVGSLGAVLKTEKGMYFIGVSVGVVQFETKNYFIVSPSSPIGQKLLGKRKNDTFRFQGKEVYVQDVF
jgi:hypothetical protein